MEKSIKTALEEERLKQLPEPLKMEVELRSLACVFRLRPWVNVNNILPAALKFLR